MPRVTLCLQALPLATLSACFLMVGCGPEKGDAKLGVVELTREGSAYTYSVHRLYGFSPEDKVIDSLRSDTRAESSYYDAPNERVVLTAKGPLENLEEAWDRIAFGWGKLPYWEELETRAQYDEPFPPALSVLYEKRLGGARPIRATLRVGDGKLYILLPGAGAPPGPPGAFRETETKKAPHRWVLAHTEEGGWTVMPLGEAEIPDTARGIRTLDLTRGNPRGSLTLSLEKKATGSLHVNRYTAHCMAHDRFALRVVDAKGRLVGSDVTAARALSTIVTLDLTGDGRDEVFVVRNDHGPTDVVVLGLNTSKKSR